MSTNTYQVPATISVATGVAATAATAAATAVSDINAALISLANGCALEFAEVTPGTVDLQANAAGNAYNGEGAMTVAADDTATAQTLVEAALASAVSSISAVTPAVTITLESSEGQGEHGYVFNQL